MIAEETTGERTREGAQTIDMQEGSPSGVLLLHGFGDTPQTLRLLAGHLFAAGHDVRAPLLPGHGLSIPAFLRSRRSDWLACARAEYDQMRASHATVSIAGLSMGGALAAIVAAENDDVSALVLISPYLAMPVPHRIASAFHWMWGPLAGPRRSSNPRSILDPEERARNLGYGVYSGRLLYELWRLAAQARRCLASISAPTLLLQSRADPRIAPAVAENAIARIGAAEKRLTWIEGGGHIITVDFGRDRVFEEAGRWIEAHTAAR